MLPELAKEHPGEVLRREPCVDIPRTSRPSQGRADTEPAVLAPRVRASSAVIGSQPITMESGTSARRSRSPPARDAVASGASLDAKEESEAMPRSANRVEEPLGPIQHGGVRSDKSHQPRVDHVVSRFKHRLKLWPGMARDEARRGQNNGECGRGHLPPTPRVTGRTVHCRHRDQKGSSLLAVHVRHLPVSRTTGPGYWRSSVMILGGIWVLQKSRPLRGCERVAAIATSKPWSAVCTSTRPSSVTDGEGGDACMNPPGAMHLHNASSKGHVVGNTPPSLRDLPACCDRWEPCVLCDGHGLRRRVRASA